MWKRSLEPRLLTTSVLTKCVTLEKSLTWRIKFFTYKIRGLKEIYKPHPGCTLKSPEKLQNKTKTTPPTNAHTSAQLNQVLWALVFFKSSQVILTCNQDFEPLVSILISKASFLIQSTILRVIILDKRFHNTIAQKATKEVRPRPCILCLCAHMTRRG